MILQENSTYTFRLTKDFDACYYEKQFVIKSKSYYFCVSEAINNNLLLSLLKSYSFKGNVVFDLLITNGLKANNRFISCYFNGSYFDWKSIKVLHINNILIHNLYYKDNIDIKNKFFKKEILTK